MEKYNESVKKVIGGSIYATIATVTPDGAPWNTPVIFAHDDNFNIFWTSFSDAVHSKNIDSKPDVFIVFFNSTTPSESTDGVYLSAKAKALSDPEEIRAAAELVYKRKQKPVPEVSAFTGEEKKRLYKATLQEMWINPGTDANKNLMDPRIKVNLSET